MEGREEEEEEMEATISDEEILLQSGRSLHDEKREVVTQHTEVMGREL